MPPDAHGRKRIRPEVLLGATLLIAGAISAYYHNVLQYLAAHSWYQPADIWEWIGLVALIVAASAAAAVVGKVFVHPLAALLLGGVGGTIASAYVWTAIGCVIGLIVGGCVAYRWMRQVAWALAACGVFALIGLLVGYLALRPDDDRLAHSIWVVASLAGALATLAWACRPAGNQLNAPWPGARERTGTSQQPDEADQPPPRSRLALLARLAWVPAVLFGSWLAVTADSLSRIQAVQQSLRVDYDVIPRRAPWDTAILWRGLVRFNIIGQPYPTSRAGTIDQDLRHLRGWEDTEGFFLRRATLTAHGLEKLAQAEKLQSVWLGGTPITDDALRSFQKALLLKRFELSGTAISDEGLAHLSQLTGLAELDLGQTQINGEGLRFLRQLPLLRSLSLWNSQADDRALEALAGAAALDALSLDGTRITDDGLRYLAKLPSLSTLRLNETQITSAGLEHVAAAKTLSILEPTDTQVSGTGLRFLQGLPSLERLDLSGTNITDDDLVHVGKIASLKVLDLSDTAVTGAGLSHLKQLQNLEMLTANSTRIDDPGALALGRLPKLSIVYLHDAQVTAAGAAALKRALPSGLNVVIVPNSQGRAPGSIQ